MNEITCPGCSKHIAVDIHGIVGEEQRFTWRVTPNVYGQPLQAQLIGGQLVALDNMMKAIAREDGGKVRTYISGARLDITGTIEFDILVLPIASTAEPRS